MAQTVPCPHPQACGVQEHIMGSDSQKMCQRISRTVDMELNQRGLTKSPKLSSSSRYRVQPRDLHLPSSAGAGPDQRVYIREGWGSSVEVTYDSVDIPDDSYYGRYISKENAELKSLDHRKLLSELFAVKEEDVPDDLVSIAQEMELEDRVVVKSTPSYYEDDIHVSIQGQDLSELIEYADRNHFLHDHYGITGYAMEHGVEDIRGKSLNELVRETLSEESCRGPAKRLIEQTTEAYTQSVKLADIVIVQQEYFDGIESSPMKRRKGPVGVLVKKDDRYHLVDGYHNAKRLLTGKRKTAQYIVME